MRNYLIAANWKMNLSKTESSNLFNEIGKGIKNLNENVEVLICAPFVHLDNLVELRQNHYPNLMVGAQNCNEKDSGAYTGEISAPMLKSYNCDYVILGHSERREIYNESNVLINEKLKNALRNELGVILCIGESLEQRKSNQTNEVLSKQLSECLNEISTLQNIVIAYEPIWAIGTGLTPTLEEIDETHTFIKNYLKQLFKIDFINTKILYGGSLNDKNAESILNIKSVDGGLIGGASLKIDSFSHIIKTAETISTN